MVKILLVDDHAIVREGLSALLSRQPDFKVVGEAGSIREAVSMAHEFKPDLVLMDYNLPDGSGVEATQAILADRPGTKILFLTVHSGDEKLFAALRAGARGYLLKSLPMPELIDSIRAVEKNEAALSPDQVWKVIEELYKKDEPVADHHLNLSILTNREMEILFEVSSFATNSEIANKLSLTETTIKNHIHAILKKLKLKNRRELAVFAQQQGINRSPKAITPPKPRQPN